ncbi:MAG: hypothetical protein LBS00_03510 [Synergistaceae bacterium]|nr:hypothetical protein [Synergistaceae bacterium]
MASRRGDCFCVFTDIQAGLPVSGGCSSPPTAVDHISARPRQHPLRGGSVRNPSQRQVGGRRLQGAIHGVRDGWLETTTREPHVIGR